MQKNNINKIDVIDWLWQEKNKEEKLINKILLDRRYLRQVLKRNVWYMKHIFKKYLLNI